MSLLRNTSKYVSYKPMAYPWAYEAYEIIQSMHWIAKEIDISGDVVDYHNLDEAKQTMIRNILRLFTTNDAQAITGYAAMLRIFKPLEVQMVLMAEGNVEAVHVDGYSLLTDSLGFPDSFYTEYIDIPVMERKIDYLEKAKVKKFEDYVALGLTHTEADFKYRQDVALMLAVYATGLEGIELMSQFALLLAYQSLGMFKGMSQINIYSIKDEFIHCKTNSMLFLTYVKENPDIYTEQLKNDIVQAIRQVVEQEEAMTNYLFDTGEHPNMTREDAHAFTRFSANKALALIGFTPIFAELENPLPFMDEVLGSVEFSNFFEVEATGYTKNATRGSWETLRTSPSKFRKCA